MKQATLDFLCGECLEHTTWKQEMNLGDNTADFTCAGCGVHWHVLFDVTSLDPLHVGISVTKRIVGYLIDGQFFAKGQMQ